MKSIITHILFLFLISNCRIYENTKPASFLCAEKTYLEPNELTTINPSEIPLSILKQMDSYHYEITLRKDSSNNFSSYFKNKKSLKIYSLKNNEESFKLKLSNFSNIIVTYYNNTGFSDFVDEGDNMYLLLQDKIYSMPISGINSKPNCRINLVASYSTNHVEYREFHNQILILLKKPECGFPADFLGKQEISFTPTDFIQTVYAKVKVTSEYIDFDQYCTNQPPEDFKILWDKAHPLQIIKIK